MNKNHTLSRRAIATLTAEKLDILRQIFWDMNAISYWVETVSGDEDEAIPLSCTSLSQSRIICKWRTSIGSTPSGASCWEN